ncbi:MAG: hypothetical protein P1V81_10035 [Planctomycetota bacterium]|nr:hypothetical protein [Planctomycetota bacterium]
MFARLPLATLLAALVLAPCAAAQTCDVLVDINTEATPLSGVNFGTTTANCNGVTYFRGWTIDHGTELWRTDGTAAGTYEVADLVPGPTGSKPEAFLCVGNLVYFTAEDAVRGRELWRTDGTSPGTFLLADIDPGVPGSKPSGMIEFAGQMVFTAFKTGFGYELWISDGTAAGTQMVGDLNPGPAGSSPAGMRSNTAQTSFLFRANDATHGSELWTSDGTAAGTYMLVDLEPGPSSSIPGDIHPLGPVALFTAFTSHTGSEPWVTDGTAAGTMLLRDISLGTSSSSPALAAGAQLGGQLYFAARSAIHGNELWATDGTATGTYLVADMLTGLGSSDPKELTVMGSEIFFYAATSFGNAELYATDAAGNVRLVKDINPNGSSRVSEMMESGGLLYFRADTALLGEEPWRSDGTDAGTFNLADLNPGPGYSFPGGFSETPAGDVLFHAQDPVVGRELFRTDGQPGGTTLITDLQPGSATGSSDPQNLTVIGGSSLYFAAEADGLGLEPYRWDPIGGAVRLKDIFQHPSSSSPDSDPFGFTQALLGGQARVIFGADSSDEGVEPWITDGTPAGTHLLKNIRTSWADSDPSEFTPAFGKVFFAATDGDRELWVTDGTTAGTVEFADLAPGSFVSSNPEHLTHLGDLLLFAAQDAAGDVELWSTDGTVAGTGLVLDIKAGFSSNPRGLTRVGDQLAFVVDRDLNGIGTELWRTDGTAAGTQLVSQLDAASYAGPSGLLVELGGFLFLSGKGFQYEGLWRSDLTPTGTVELASHGFLELDELVAADGKVFYTVSGQLHASDGTVAGTSEVSAHLATHGPVYPTDLVAVGDGVYFSALFSSVFDDQELHFSDGTSAGTQLACDVFPGSSHVGFSPELPNDSEPAELVLVDGHLVFAARNSFTVGRELFRVPLPGPYSQDLGLSGAGHHIATTVPRLGDTITVTGHGAAAGVVSLLGLNAPLPTPKPLFVATGHVAWLSPAAAILLTTTTTPSWSWSTFIPADPGLVGGQLNLQSWTPQSGTFPAETSNGVRLVMGF